MRRALPVAGLMTLLALALPACSVFENPPQVRGTKVDPDSIKELRPGVTTRNDVSSLLGSPTAKAAFDDNTWLYIEEVTRPRIAATQHVLDQHVIALSFDDKGVLRDITQLGDKDAQPMDMIARATPSPGSNASFMQQLLGNVGRFNAAPGSGSPIAGTNSSPIAR